MNSTTVCLQRWAALYSALRAHFLATDTLEVSTPVLSQAGITDPNIHSLSTLVQGAGRQYLHTSPEFAMKRLVAAGCGDCYQIGRVFRDGEQGRLHRPEFQMCEWYRLGWDERRLMREVDQLLQQLWRQLGCSDITLQTSQFLSYLETLELACQLPVSSWSSGAIRDYLATQGIHSSLTSADPLDSWLDLLISSVVVPQFKTDRLTFLYDYPASQAALARTEVNSQGDAVARRFEVFFGPVELANGFFELNSASQQRDRFAQERRRREQLGLPEIPVDELFLSALQAGLPDCAGVAVGLDRLMMALHGMQNIAETQALECLDA